MREYQDIYDIHRNLTGKTIQRGQPRKNGEFVLVVHLLLFDQKGRFLVQKRVEHKASFPDMWDISTGGMAQTGDTSLTAITREAQEELGITLDFSNTAPIFSFRSQNTFDDYWLAEINSENLNFKLQSEEVAETRWVTEQEWLALIATHQVIPYSFQNMLFDLYKAHFSGTRVFPFGNPEIIKGAIFDMDGLLLDTEKICDNSWDEAGKIFHFSDIEHAKKSCIGLNEAGTREFFEINYPDFDYTGFRALSRKLTKEALAESIPVKQGAEEILIMLKQKQIALAVASSTREITVKNLLERAGLLQYFDKIITGDMVQKGKPNPEIFTKACKALQLAPETCIAFEDSVNGIRSAYRAKTFPIHIPDLHPENMETSS
ncbi:MAG: HAD-IA family hydrolase, partial [Oscillospiraceae bacterium]|nr:HAD-IA family hydrolase [Oscillospiraceae bacterium]